MLIDKQYPDRVRRVLWRFKIMTAAIEMFHQADASLSEEERDLLKIMSETERNENGATYEPNISKDTKG